MASQRQRAGVHRLRERSLQHLRDRHRSSPPAVGALATDRAMPPCCRRANRQPDDGGAAARRAAPPGCRSRSTIRGRGLQAPSCSSKRSASRRSASARIGSAPTRPAASSFMFSDMLGDHTLGATVQSTSRIRGDRRAGVLPQSQVALELGRRRRADCRTSPAATRRGSRRSTARTAIVQETRARHAAQLRRRAAIAQYPFSRVQRVEFSGGRAAHRLRPEVETQFFSPVTGQLFDEQTEELPRPDALNLGEASAALVYDSSIFGATSPLVGQRYRFEYSQTGGHAQYRRRARRLPPLLHAGAAVHVRRARHALRPLRRATPKTRGCRRCSSATRAWCAATTSDRSTPTNASRST